MAFQCFNFIFGFIAIIAIAGTEIAHWWTLQMEVIRNYFLKRDQSFLTDPGNQGIGICLQVFPPLFSKIQGIHHSNFKNIILFFHYQKISHKAKVSNYVKV